MATQVKSKSGKVAGRKFAQKMGLHEARIVLLATVRGVKAGGFTERCGKALKATLGLKFGSYVPSDVMDSLRADGFGKAFKAEVAAWVKAWEPGVSDATMAARQKQLQAVEAFIAGKGWERVADAIESMLAARSAQVVVEDNAGNRRVHSLIDVLDLMFSIRMTPARAASLKLIA